MMKTMYGSISEWDLGLEGQLFSSPEEVAAAQKTMIEDPGLGFEDSYEELAAENLVGFEEIEVPVEALLNSLTKLRSANRLRQTQWPGYEGAADALFRAVEFGGESGELLDAVKKLTRAQRGIAGNTGQDLSDLRQAVMEEIGDVVISLDMLADELGFAVEDCVPMKFNKTSRKVGIPVEMDASTWDAGFIPENVSPSVYPR